MEQRVRKDSPVQDTRENDASLVNLSGRRIGDHEWRSLIGGNCIGTDIVNKEISHP